jgi:hypothetical protein
MTTTSTHAAPWTFRRFLSMFTGQTTPRRRAARPTVTHVLTGREAVARMLYGEAVHWSTLDMLNYDNQPFLQTIWLAKADRRIANPISPFDFRVMHWHGCTRDQWIDLPAIVKADKRESFMTEQGL